MAIGESVIEPCFICHRSSSGRGHARESKATLAQIKWHCNECGIERARKIDMKKFNHTEIRAIESMSPLIGVYVEKRIGSTDFSTWTHQQWFDFLRTVAHEFGEAMRRVTHEP